MKNFIFNSVKFIIKQTKNEGMNFIFGPMEYMASVSYKYYTPSQE